MSKSRNIADLGSNDVLETTSTGVDVTGTVTADGLTLNSGGFDYINSGSFLYTNVPSGYSTTIQAGGLNVANFTSGGDISFYEDTGVSAKFFWDASAESLGIGTSSPKATNTSSNSLHINAPTYPEIRLTNSTTGETTSDGFLMQVAGTTQHVYLWNQENSATIFGTNATERMRIDSSGNVLVGKTSDTFTTTGITLRNPATNGSALTSTADGKGALALNRLTSDGDMAIFYKDGSTVGSIGTRAGYATIGKGDVGLLFQDANNRIEPNNHDGLTGSDAAIDLGSGTTRFKDLYLSGGVHLGGTGSANYLDDYEEGTFTPGLTDSSGNAYTTGSGTYGTYTKVGNIVYVTVRVNPTAINSAGSNLRVTNMPFTGITNNRCGGSFSFTDFPTPSGYSYMSVSMDGSLSYVDLKKQGSITTGMTSTDIGTNDFGFSLTYLTAT